MAEPPRRRVEQTPRGPGLAKAGAGALVARRSLEMCSLHAGLLEHGFRSADVVSEGELDLSGDPPTYFGSTSVLLAARSRGGLLPDDELARLAVLVAHDPHAHLLALRLARREARCRSPEPLGTVRAELRVRAREAGVVVDVDVVAAALATSRSRAVT
jgi:hypothetical protein